MNKKILMSSTKVVCLFVVLDFISFETATGSFVEAGFYDLPRYEGYVHKCGNDSFSANDTCPLNDDISYRSVRFLKGTCVELSDSKNSVFITENNEDIGESFKGGYAKKCETYKLSLNCPDGFFAKQVEWDTKVELTLGIKLSCYRPEFYRNNAIVLESLLGAQFLQSDKRKCAAIYGITFKIDVDKDAVVDLDLKNNCTEGYAKGVRSFCVDQTALSGMNVLIEKNTNYIKNVTIVCSVIPNIATTCKAVDEEQILLSYNGSTTNAELTLTVQKKFGVGLSLVMSEFNRNEYDFYISSGFEIGKSISTLSENFKKNLGVSSETNYDWGSSPDNMWQEEQSTLIEVKTKPGCATEVFETVGRCSFMDVRLAKYTRVDICDGESNATVVDIPNSVVNLTYRSKSFKPDNNNRKTSKYKGGVVRNNAVEVVATRAPFAYSIEKFLNNFG